jgi:poly(3-hydroxybutyrate) depolymerase
VNLKVLITRALFAVAMGFACVVTISAQAVETGFLNRMVLVDGVEYRYQVYVPRDFRRSMSWPVILALHGGGNYGTAAMGFFRPPEPWPTPFAGMRTASRPSSCFRKAT